MRASDLDPKIRSPPAAACRDNQARRHCPRRPGRARRAPASGNARSAKSERGRHAATPTSFPYQAGSRCDQRDWKAEQRWVEQIIDQKLSKFVAALGAEGARIEKNERERMPRSPPSCGGLRGGATT